MCMKELSRFAVLFGLLMPASVTHAQPAPRPLCSGTVDAQLLCLNVLVGELLAHGTVMQSGNQPMPPADDWGERENVAFKPLPKFESRPVVAASNVKCAIADDNPDVASESFDCQVVIVAVSTSGFIYKFQSEKGPPHSLLTGEYLSRNFDWIAVANPGGSAPR